MHPMKFGGGQENDPSNAVSEWRVPSVWNNMAGLTMREDLIDMDTKLVYTEVQGMETAIDLPMGEDRTTQEGLLTTETRGRSPTPVLHTEQPTQKRGRKRRSGTQRVPRADRSLTPVIEPRRQITMHFKKAKRVGQDGDGKVTHTPSSIGSSAQRETVGAASISEGTRPSNIAARFSAVSTKTSTGL